MTVNARRTPPAASTERHTDLEIAEMIRSLRARLLTRGYEHANAVGELRNSHHTVWVGTAYTHGEYSVYAWSRPRGHGEVGEQRTVMRITAYTDPARVKKLVDDLAYWGHRTPTEDVQRRWPPRGTEPSR